MAGPWEKYAAPADTGPWAKFQAPAPEETTLGQDVAQGAGNVVAGLVRGAGSFGATILAPYDMAKDALAGKGLSLESNRQRRADMDAGLQTMGAQPDSLLYQGGKLAGEIAGTAGVGGALANGVRAVAPGANALTNAIATSGMRAGTVPAGANLATNAGNLGLRAAGGAITGGASAALINPEEAAKGAAISAALPVALSGVGKAGKALGSQFAIGERNRPLAQKAVQQYGIPLGVGDIAEGSTIKSLRSILNDAPFSGAIGAAQRDGVQEGFNRAVGGTFGAAEPKLTAQVVDAAKQRMGSEFDRIWNHNALQVDGELMSKMMTLQAQAAKLPKNEGASLTAEINDLMSKMVPDAAGGAAMPGEAANKFQSYLRRRAEGSAGLKNELGDLRQAIISAFNRSVRPEDAAALTQNRAQYKAFKTVEPLLNSAEAGVAGRMPGDVPAALLPQAVARQYSQAAGAPLTDLAQIGSRFIVDRTPKTGGSMRAALQNTALGTALVGGGLSNPLLAAGAIPAAAGVNGLLGSSRLAQALLAETPPNRLAQLLSSPEVAQLPYLAAPALSAR